jgi:hypothetical protein
VIHDRDSIFSNALDKGVTDLGVRVLRTPVRAPMANAKFLQLGHGVQDQPGFAPETVELEDLAAFRPAIQGDGAGNAVVGVDAVGGQIVQLTVPFSSVRLAALPAGAANSTRSPGSRHVLTE